MADASAGTAGGGFSAGGIDQPAPIDQPAGATVAPAVPMLNDWLRPSLVVGKVLYQLSVVTFGVPGTLSLALMNPGRVGLFLSHSLTSPNILTAGLNNNGAVHPILFVPALDTKGGTLADMLSLICGEWLGTLPAAGSVYVTELIRRS